jgi:hypothetical protein
MLRNYKELRPIKVHEKERHQRGMGEVERMLKSLIKP